MSKVFVRPEHQAYARRAKNDQIVAHISSKFGVNESEHKKNALQAEGIATVGTGSEAAEARAKNRKQLEAEMKEVLDLQVRRQQQEKEMAKKEQQDIGQRIQADVLTFEQEQQKRKAEISQRQKNHQKEVTRQIEDRRTLLKHIGSQVVVNH